MDVIIFLHKAVKARLHFTQPLPSLGAIGMIKVSDNRFRERLAKHRHALLPPLFSDHGESLDIAEVFHAEFEILPRRTGLPALKGAHIKQHAQFSVLPDESFELGHKVFIIRFFQFATDMNNKPLATIFFIDLNGHFIFLLFFEVRFLYPESPK
jgi:hypothetical protein